MDRTIRRDMDLVFDGINLRAYTKTVDGEEIKVIGGTASSTALDLYESIISKSCQVQMKEKLQNLAARMADRDSGLTAWLNHSYQIPEDTLGAFIKAGLATRNEGGQEFVDLDIECRVTDTNPRALAAWQQVKDGIRHGWSIGAYFREAHFASDDPDSDDFWTLIIDDIELLEISLVGIPANQRAWCRGSEDLKAKAVQTAEEIAREAREHPKELAQRFGVRETRIERHQDAKSRLIRSLSVRSLVAPEDAYESVDAVLDAVADATTTAPITREVEVEPAEQDKTLELYDALIVAGGSPVAAEVVEEGQEIGQEEAALLSAAAAVTEPAETQSVESADATPIADELRTLDAETLEEFLDHPETSRVAGLFARAADAIDTLTIASRAQDALATRDDAIDPKKISEAIGYCAEAVGHGLCIRSAKAIGSAVKSLAGSVVDQPGPEGDGDPGELFSTEDIQARQAEIDALDQTLAQRKAELEEADSLVVRAQSELSKLSTQVDGLIVRAQSELSELSTQVDARKSELAELQASTEKANAELIELKAKVEEAAKRRLGRMGSSADVNAMLTEHGESEVRPEHYRMTDSQRMAALRRLASGEPAKSGRDLAAS